MNLDRVTADRISDYLDAVVTGDATRSLDLDPTLAATVEHFFAADDAPGPPPGLAEHLWQDLLQQYAAPVGRLPSGPVEHPDLNARRTLGSMAAPLPQRGLSGPRWALAQLATAALVLLTLIASFLALRGSLRLMGQEEQPASIPAIEGASEAVTLVAALVTTWPAGGPPFGASIQRITFDPGAVEEAGTADTTGVGPDLFTVESGQVTVDADGPVVVTRGPADRRAEPTTVPAGTTIILDEGDQLFAPSEVSLHRRNDTSVPAGILDFHIADLEQVHRSSGVHYVRILPDKVLNASPPTPAEAALYRLRLLPGRSLSIHDLPGLQMLYVEEGTLDLMGARGPGDLVPVSRASISAGSGMAHFETTPELANRSADPVTLLIATIGPSQ